MKWLAVYDAEITQKNFFMFLWTKNERRSVKRMDKEKVVKGLEICTTRPCYCTDCPYKANCCLDSQEVMEDALVLIKEQQEEIQNLRKENNSILTQFHEWAKQQKAVEPKEIVNEHFPIGDYRRTIGWLCGKCGKPIMGDGEYCSYCGQAVKWDERPV